MNLTELFSVCGRRAIVTGGSQGIGRMIAEGLVLAGADVVIVGRDEARLATASAELAKLGRCRAVAADLATEDGVATVVATACGTADDAVDILINNAGTTWGAPLADFPIASFNKVLSVNLSAPFALTRALLPALRRAGTAEHPARVVNIASVDGIRPPRRPTYPYAASKAAMIMLTRHLAADLAGDRITVNAIAPGLFETKMTATLFDPAHAAHQPMSTLPLGDRPGRAEDIVGAVLYLASSAGSHVTGVVLPVAGGEATAF